MSRKAFHLLLKKYLDGTCSPQERELIDQWYELLDDEGLKAKETEDLSLIEERIWQRIQSEMAIQPFVAPSKKNRWTLLPAAYRWVAAAFLLIVAGASFFIIKYMKTEVTSLPIAHLQHRNDFYTKTNNTTAVMPVMLTDSSMVQLQPGSTLSYPKQFVADKREVYLEGAAYFKVTKNAARPFLVYTG